MKEPPPSLSQIGKWESVFLPSLRDLSENWNWVLEKP